MRQAHQAQEDLKQRDNELEKMKHRAEQAEAEKSRTDKDLIASLKDANNARDEKHEAVINAKNLESRCTAAENDAKTQREEVTKLMQRLNLAEKERQDMQKKIEGYEKESSAKGVELPTISGLNAFEQSMAAGVNVCDTATAFIRGFES
jgi:chromosome segregation ATPase